jgi:hypothetical protein
MQQMNPVVAELNELVEATKRDIVRIKLLIDKQRNLDDELDDADDVEDDDYADYAGWLMQLDNMLFRATEHCKDYIKQLQAIMTAPGGDHGDHDLVM